MMMRNMINISLNKVKYGRSGPSRLKSLLINLDGARKIKLMWLLSKSIMSLEGRKNKRNF